MFSKLWKDEAGIVAFEYLALATIVGLGITVGLVAVRNALNVELHELANAIMALNQQYSFLGESNCKAAVWGSAAGPDQCGNLSIGYFAPTPCPINQNACP
jgi:Flp pilus assembly pilin Flp